MPSRPSQSSAAQLARWQERRSATGARIRELRLAQELSQEALALESGLSRNMVIGLEWGRKSVAYERLWDIADVLGVSITELLELAAVRPERKAYRGGRRPMGSSGYNPVDGPECRSIWVCEAQIKSSIIRTTFGKFHTLRNLRGAGSVDLVTPRAAGEPAGGE